MPSGRAPAPRVELPLTLEAIPDDRPPSPAPRTCRPHLPPSPGRLRRTPPGPRTARRPHHPGSASSPSRPSPSRPSTTVFGRFLGPKGLGADAADPGSSISVEPRSDPAAEAAVKRRIEKQVEQTLGDRVRSVEVRVSGRTVVFRAQAVPLLAAARRAPEPGDAPAPRGLSRAGRDGRVTRESPPGDRIRDRGGSGPPRTSFERPRGCILGIEPGPRGRPAGPRSTARLEPAWSTSSRSLDDERFLARRLLASQLPQAIFPGTGRCRRRGGAAGACRLGSRIPGQRDQDRPDRLRRAGHGGRARRPRRGHEGHLSVRGLPHRGRRRRGQDRARRTSRSSPWPTCSTTGSSGRAASSRKLGIDIAAEPLLHRVRRLQAAARDPRDQLRDPGHAASFPADSPQGRHRGGQERLHREARGRRRARASTW